jgi:hypothetical protein
MVRVQGTAVLRDRDPFLRRIERDAMVACIVMTVVVGAIWWDRSDIPLGVLAGGVVAAISYTGIKSGIDAVARPARHGRAARWAMVRFFTRYAIVAAAAYLVMVRVRLHPAAIVAGASSPVIAAAAEAVRAARNRTSDNPRRS